MSGPGASVGTGGTGARPAGDVVAPGAVVLHIGPHKTGTTTLQAALFEARRRLARAGVLFPADSAHPRAAFRAATGARGVRGESDQPSGEWPALVSRVRGATGQRVVISSEMLTDAEPDRLAAIVGELGADRAHIVITLRSLAKILPSQWQEYLQSRRTISYPDWLEKVFGAADSRAARGFWRRHAHDELVARCVALVGAERVTVVVGDDSDPRFLLAAFERLLGLPAETLRLGENRNRSMTLGEAELVRLVNLEAERRGWTDEKYAAVVREDLCYRLTSRPPGPGDPPLVTPRWALDAAARRQARSVAAIAGSGVRVIGDLDRLGQAAAAGAHAGADRGAEPAEDPLVALAGLVAGFALRDLPDFGADAAAARAVTRALAARGRQRAKRLVQRD